MKDNGGKKTTGHALGERASLEANSRYTAAFPHGRPPGERPGAKAIDLLQAPSGRPVHCAGTVVLNSFGQILVGFNVKRQVWDVPQGVVEDDESIASAALRELLEETALLLTPGQIHCIGTFGHRTPEFGYAFVNHIFILNDASADLSGVTNMEPTKCTDLRWAAPCQLPSPRGLSLRLALVLLGRTE